jgi:hypothetical protein
MLNMEHIIYVQGSFFNTNSMVMFYFVIGQPYLIIISGMLNMEHIIYVRDSFFNMNSMVMFDL